GQSTALVMPPALRRFVSPLTHGAGRFRGRPRHGFVHRDSTIRAACGIVRAGPEAPRRERAAILAARAPSRTLLQIRNAARWRRRFPTSSFGSRLLEAAVQCDMPP